MAEVAGIIEEPFGRGGIGVEVDSPIHEGGCAPDGENDGVDVVHGHGFDDHSLGAGSPVGVDVSIAFGTLGLVIDSLGILGCEAEKRPGGDVSVSVSERSYGKLTKSTYSLKGAKSIGNLELA